MKRIVVALALIAAAYMLGGCEGPDKKVDDSKAAPPPTYHMVPSQKDPNYDANK
ncbi:MAG: hypothetical protein JSS65_09545 [Armatimonadetes bacterium]|nr:hypothetical protein [Armatimonadota bacterium]